MYHVQFPGLGLECTVNRVAFTIGTMEIYWYGICIAIGLLLGVVYVLRNARRFGVNDDRFIDVIFLCTICSIVCARAFYVIFAPFEYTSIWEIISIRDGGVAIYGAVIGAFLSGLLFCRLRKIPTLPAFDLAAMGFLIGQAVGRWGNFFNQEAFGTNTTLPWGMYSEGTQYYLSGMQSTLAQSGVMVDPFAPVHPTFLYESLWCLLGFILLACYAKHRRFNGEISLMYLVWYGAERAVVEGLRTDSLNLVGNVRVSQMIAIVTAVLGVVLLMMLRKKYKDTPLMVSYAFPVAPKDKNSPLMLMTWRADSAMPTQAEIELAYQQKQLEETTEESPMEEVEDESEEATKEEVEEKTKDASTGEANEDFEDAPEKEAKVETEDTPKEEAKEEATDVPKEEAKAETEDAPKEEAKDEAEETPKEEVEEETKDASKEEIEEETKDAPKEEIKDESEETPKEEVEEETKDAPKEEATAATKAAPKKTKKRTTKSTAKKSTKKSTKQPKKTAAKEETAAEATEQKEDADGSAD